MGDLTNDTPKPMLAVSEKPFLEHRLELLPEEITDVIFVIGYLAARVRNHFGNEWKGRKVSYVVQEELNGTAGAIQLAKDLVGDKFLVTNGDDFYHPEDLQKLMRHETAVLGYEVQDASPYGIMLTDDEGHLADIVEKPHGYKRGVINTGAYMLSRDFFNYPPVRITEKEFGLPQTLMTMKDDCAIKVVKAKMWQPLGSPEDFAGAEAFLKNIERSELIPT
jgi:bifunctional UDP-N-acetylglucosamine pyrophosphorylase/glucosamine-1-phosphate N-acetyltransferase